MKLERIRIATRKSPLAIWQAEHVQERLQALHPGLQVELIGMQTEGDRILDAPLAKIGGKGLFIKELEQRLLEHSADIAVHSMKDVTVDLPGGLALPVILEREDPRDAFISNEYSCLEALPRGAVVGTSSLRRQCQLKALRPDLMIRDLRGNVGTRLGKLDAGEYAAIILAVAGVMRLGQAGRIRTRLEPEQLLPAIGQGAIGIECRAGDTAVEELLRPLDHAATHTRVLAERGVNRRLDGGCQVPIAAHALLDHGRLFLRGLVGRVDGSEIIRAEVEGPAARAEALGMELGEALLVRGADAILAELMAQ